MWALWDAKNALGWLQFLVEVLYTGASLLFLYVIFVMPHLRRHDDVAAQLLHTEKCSTQAERWLVSLSFWIPRKYREAIAGDIFEDCREMREKGFSESRIRVHVLWQLAVAVIALWPEAVGSAVGSIIKQVWKTKQ
jgi:hypothetical protein